MIAFAASATALLLLDRMSKRIVEIYLADRCLSCGRIVRIRRVSTVKSIYERSRARAALVLVWVAALGSAIALRQSGARFQSDVAVVALGFAFGGSAGNLLDIVRRHSVVDFIDLGWWPVFNLADVAIGAGLVVAFTSGH